MSAAASAIVLLGGLALEGVKAYNQAKAAQTAATESDQAAIAELDKQIAAEVAGANAAEKQLDQDLGGIGGTAQQI